MTPEEVRQRKLMRDFGQRLRAARVLSGHETADDMAETLRIGGSRYRKYERGEAIPPLYLIEQICRITRTTGGQLLFGEPGGMPSPARRDEGAE